MKLFPTNTTPSTPAPSDIFPRYVCASLIPQEKEKRNRASEVNFVRDIYTAKVTLLQVFCVNKLRKHAKELSTIPYFYSLVDGASVPKAFAERGQ